MNANELTARYNEIIKRVKELENIVNWLEQESEKQRLLLDDISIDVQMLQGRRRNG